MDESKQKLVEQYPWLGCPRCDEFDRGWVGVIGEMAVEIETAVAASGQNIEQIRVAQIKSKFGSLRVYYRLPDDWPADLRLAIGRIVDTAGERAAATCDRCGEPGTTGRVAGSGYIATRCDAHRDDIE